MLFSPSGWFCTLQYKKYGVDYIGREHTDADSQLVTAPAVSAKEAKEGAFAIKSESEQLFLD